MRILSVFRSDRLMDELWSCRAPRMSNLIGTWRITMMTGPILDLSRWRHTKCLWLTGSGIKGHNVLDLGSKRIWGAFDVKHKDYDLILVYHHHHIVDYVRQLDNNTMIGRFFWKSIFLGYFLMIRERS